MSAELLSRQLDGVREHCLGALEGLAEEDLRRAVLPSGWSMLEMIKHLTYDEEKFWFGCVVAGDETEIGRLEALRGTTWTVGPETPADAVITAYRDAIATSNAIIASRSMDSPPAWWPGELFGEWRLTRLEEIMVHMIVEVSCHAGHLDAARELIDGTQWLVLTD